MDDIKYIIDHIEYRTTVIMTEQQAIEFISNEPKIKSNLTEWGFDTVVRELLDELLAREFANSSWPTYSDDLSEDDYNDFIEKIRTAAKEKYNKYV